MVCGDRASTVKSKVMTWHPPWIWALIPLGLLPVIILALVLQKRMRLEGPFCEQHQNHWRNRTLVIWLSFLGVFLVGFGLLFMAAALEQGRPGQGDIFGWLCLLGVVLGVGWLILTGILSFTAVRPKEITDTSITLAGVSESFVEAMEDYEAEGDEPPRRRPAPRARGDDDRFASKDTPRRRRPPPDAYTERDCSR